MKKKEPKKIRLSTAILCLIVLVLIGGIIYFAIQNNNLKKTNGETENQIGEFQTQVKELENKVEQQQNVEVNSSKDTNTSLNQVADKSDKYKLITKKLDLKKDEEIFVVTDVENNEGKCTLKGRIYTEYTITKNEYNDAKNTGEMTINGKEYTVKKEEDSEALELYDKSDKSEYYKYVISFREDKGTYVLRSDGQIDICYKATNDYRKIIVEDNVRCLHISYNGSADIDEIIEDTTVKEYFKDFKNITEKNIEPGELLPNYDFEFKNGKCTEIKIKTIFI